ncbi:PilZ domain-containing protein [Pseudomonas sp. C27(2019)]|uniref:PilZ domain-containing protein n=1 Tax=Pseudomonas sp. C27(2019) TaxID=2604941 RepID=UPI001244F0B6|nr:PilZ domain-containing protein [Pseudomonas sp. C27(2019)]QEY57830.1 PilZ domain-containing protein [Pseudomonas sp. C27(2019)]
MNERRHNPRHTTEQALEAYDVHSARFLGRFVDISEDGFLLFCPQNIDVDSIWQIRVLEANDQHFHSILSFGAECLWIRQADDDNHCWAGFQIIDISAQDTKKLKALFCSPE